MGTQQFGVSVASSVVPNPGNGLLQLNRPGFREFDLEIRDALGRIVHRKHLFR